MTFHYMAQKIQFQFALIHPVFVTDGPAMSYHVYLISIASNEMLTHYMICKSFKLLTVKSWLPTLIHPSAIALFQYWFMVGLPRRRGHKAGEHKHIIITVDNLLIIWIINTLIKNIEY